MSDVRNVQKPEFMKYAMHFVDGEKGNDVDIFIEMLQILMRLAREILGEGKQNNYSYSNLGRRIGALRADKICLTIGSRR